jgi:hypothetical protein
MCIRVPELYDPGTQVKTWCNNVASCTINEDLTLVITCIIKDVRYSLLVIGTGFLNNSGSALNDFFF